VGRRQLTRSAIANHERQRQLFKNSSISARSPALHRHSIVEDDRESDRRAIRGKGTLIKQNLHAVQRRDWALPRSTADRAASQKVEKVGAMRILSTGNDAPAGLRFWRGKLAAWYPINPSSPRDAFAAHCNRIAATAENKKEEALCDHQAERARPRSALSWGAWKRGKTTVARCTSISPESTSRVSAAHLETCLESLCLSELSAQGRSYIFWVRRNFSHPIDSLAQC